MPSDESKGSQLDAIGSLAQHQLDNTVENAPKSLSRHDGASVIRACRQRCEELVAETLVRIPGDRERRFQPKVNIHSKAS